MEKGKLYRVNDYAVSSAWEWSVQNRDLVAHYGYLWLWDGDFDDDANYMLRSLATGDLQLWYPSELEAVDAGEG